MVKKYWISCLVLDKNRNQENVLFWDKVQLDSCVTKLEIICTSPWIVCWFIC